MDLNESVLREDTQMSPRKPASNGLRVRDMIKRYNTATMCDSAKASYASFVSAKSSYFGVNSNTNIENNNATVRNSPTKDACSNSTVVGSSSRSSSGSRQARSPRIEMQNDVQLETQKSFMNLSRSREPPKAAPREKKPRYSAGAAGPSFQQTHPKQDEHVNVTDSSYQSKTTISKTPNGVRIIIDIFFDQNRGLSVEDVVGSRVETDIPPSKILTEFQKRVAESSRN